MSIATHRGRTVELRERVAGGASRIDAEAGVIRDVRILGFESKNGRSYTREALQNAVSMYEGIQVNVDHPADDLTYGRSVGDRIGWLAGVHLAADGLRGDLHLLKSHAQFATVIEAAERRPQLIGLSHNAQGRVRDDRNGGQVIEEIERVVSVDLVADPATTSGLFESTGQGHYERMRDAVRSGRSLTTAERRLFEEEDFATRPGNVDTDNDLDIGDTIKKASADAAKQALAYEIGKVCNDETLSVAQMVAAIAKIVKEFEGSSTFTADDGRDYKKVDPATGKPVTEAKLRQWQANRAALCGDEPPSRSRSYDELLEDIRRGR